MSLNVGGSHYPDQKQLVSDELISELSINQRIRSQMVEELLLRSDADFICLQNVSKQMYSQWLQNQSLIRIYGLTFDKKWYQTALPYQECNMIITRWPSYVYEARLSDSQNFKSLYVVEVVNGINKVPILIASVNLDQGILSHGQRLKELKIALETLKET